jgi:3-oxoadipate enol-lactonase
MTVPDIALTEPVGPVGRPLVVLGPSLGTSTILWERVAPVLAERFRVTAWDLPGHGAAPPATAPFTVAELADAVADAVTALGEAPLLYAGVSLGGATGLELAIRHPDLFAAAAIIASGAQLGDPAAWHDRAAQVRAQGTSSVIAGSAARWFAPGSIDREPDLSGRLLHALQDADDESYARCCEALATFDVRDRLDSISTPILVVWGEHDGVAPEQKQIEIIEGVANGRSVRVTDAAHLPPAEQPETVARLLLAFFEEATA